MRTTRRQAEPRHGITVLVPARNEADSVGDTVWSLRRQTHPPDEIVVIDDCSTDRTAERARAAGARVVRPARSTGTKAGAQNFALPIVQTTYVMAIGAGTMLAPDAIENLLPSLTAPRIAAACVFLLPRHMRAVWERGRYIEYVVAFTGSNAQDVSGRPLISSVYFSLYRTDVLRELGGWPTTTPTEEMDLTWRIYQSGQAVRFVPELPHVSLLRVRGMSRWTWEAGNERTTGRFFQR